MIKFDKVYKFNTKRGYSKEGQIILFKMVHLDDDKSIFSVRAAIYFHDTARHIVGIIPIFFSNYDLVTVDWIMAMYDNYQYRNCDMQYVNDRIFGIVPTITELIY